MIETDLRSPSESTARAIFDDAVVAYNDPSHPCHLFRFLQHGVPDDQWQLPEGFNGHAANAGLVFLGLNPSYDPNENVPRIGCSFEEWDAHCRCRFDVGVTWHKLYARYQRVGEAAIGTDFRLGWDGMVLECIRFRSADSEGTWDPGVREHELPITGRLLTDVAPRVIVANGSDALLAAQLLFPALQAQLPIPTPVTSVERRPFDVEASWGRVTVVPTRHLSGAWHYKDWMPEAIGAVAGEALGTS